MLGYKPLFCQSGASLPKMNQTILYSKKIYYELIRKQICKIPAMTIFLSKSVAVYVT